MPKRSRRPIVVLGLAIATAAGAAAVLGRSTPAPPLVGIVRTTEIRVAPEVGGQLAAIRIRPGERVHTGDIVAELSALELTASFAQARDELASAIA